jgi:hypothetical protein
MWIQQRYIYITQVGTTCLLPRRLSPRRMNCGGSVTLARLQAGTESGDTIDATRDLNGLDHRTISSGPVSESSEILPSTQELHCMACPHPLFATFDLSLCSMCLGECICGVRVWGCVSRYSSTGLWATRPLTFQQALRLHRKQLHSVNIASRVTAYSPGLAAIVSTAELSLISGHQKERPVDD